MFEPHFSLRENPFVAGHQSRFVYPSPEHQEALAHLRYGIENREPFVLITGEVGTGKTTALFEVLNEWKARAVVAVVTNSALSRNELLEEIALRLGFSVQGALSKPQILSHLERNLLALHAKGERAILLLDEAQNLDRDLLEEIRLLSNLEAQGEKLLQVFLLGQPELDAKLSQPELRQLRQRVAVHYRLNPLTAEDTERYIHHRVAVAGGYGPKILPHDTCAEGYTLSHGIPRAINQICCHGLLNAFGEDPTERGPVGPVAAAPDEANWEAWVRSLMTSRPEHEDVLAHTTPPPPSIVPDPMHVPEPVPQPARVPEPVIVPEPDPDRSPEPPPSPSRPEPDPAPTRARAWQPMKAQAEEPKAPASEPWTPSRGSKDLAPDAASSAVAKVTSGEGWRPPLWTPEHGGRRPSYVRASRSEDDVDEEPAPAANRTTRWVVATTILVALAMATILFLRFGPPAHRGSAKPAASASAPAVDDAAKPPTETAKPPAESSPSGAQPAPPAPPRRPAPATPNATPPKAPLAAGDAAPPTPGPAAS